jgi:NADH-quinone oxidoreductase subunit F
VSARHWCIVLLPTDLVDSMYYESPKDAQSGLGTCAVIVVNKSTDIIAAIGCFSHVRPPHLAITVVC